MSVTTEPARASSPTPPVLVPTALLRRKCACGSSPGLAGECAACRKKKLAGGRTLQRMLTIGAANDPAECEADRVADTVMRTTAPETADVGSHPAGITLRRRADGSAGVGEAPPIVHDVLASPGHPLDTGARTYFEPRFGRDLSHVRVHSDARAAESARAVNATAYTVGNQVVFGAGAYAPGSDAGWRLLAHELAHVEQQGGGVVRRACGKDIGKPGGCTPVGGDITDTGATSTDLFPFVVSCDDPTPEAKSRLQALAGTLPPDGPIEVHGFASVDGNADFNQRLSCARALAAAAILAGNGVDPTRITLFAHGPTPGEATDRRSVVVTGRSSAPPTPPTPAPPAKFTPPAHCPSDFCQPFPTRAAAIAHRARWSGILLGGVALAVDSRVVAVWRTHLAGGSATVQDFAPTFGADFTASPTTADSTDFLVKAIKAKLRAALPTFPTGATHMTIPIGTLIPTEIAELEVPGGRHEMNFDVPSDVPGNLAGGVGKDQTKFPIGANPSPINDERKADGTIELTRTSGGTIDVTTAITFNVKDTVDLCPGDCGTSLEQVATVPFSRYEATGISGDVPFKVTFPAPVQRFTI